MAHKAVVDAVAAYLAAQWTLCPVLGLNGQGEPPPDGAPYLMVQYPVATVARLALGTPCYREEGGIRFVLHLPRGEGLERVLAWADTLAALFRYQTFDGVETQAPTPPFLDDGNDNGLYFVASVVAPYAFTFTD